MYLAIGQEDRDLTLDLKEASVDGQTLNASDAWCLDAYLYTPDSIFKNLNTASEILKMTD